jgi:hypothetical protein
LKGGKQLDANPAFQAGAAPDNLAKYRGPALPCKLVFAGRAGSHQHDRNGRHVADSVVASGLQSPYGGVLT